MEPRFAGRRPHQHGSAAGTPSGLLKGSRFRHVEEPGEPTPRVGGGESTHSEPMNGSRSEKYYQLAQHRTAWEAGGCPDHKPRKTSHRGLRAHFWALSFVEKVLVNVAAAVLFALLAFLAHQLVNHLHHQTTAPPTTAPPSTAPPSTAPPTTASQTTASQHGCVLTIDYPYTTTRAQPSFSLQSGTNVPEGTYQALGNQMVSWGGAQTRWFEISVSGTPGWVPDNGIEITDKSAQCP